jgi:hypothetical protein
MEVINKREERNRLLSCGLFSALIGFTWGLSPAINWSSLSTHYPFHFHTHPLFINSIRKYLSMDIRVEE